MKYQVLITPMALAEVQEAYEWLLDKAPRAADRWRESLLKAIHSLETLPKRCGLAPESDHFRREIRQLLHGKRRGIYRILFEVRDTSVVVLRVRHGARRFLGELE
jgi:plasmid stabilization system protein ParE